jgi:hypothetical protein
MKAVYDACIQAKVSIPDEVIAFSHYNDLDAYEEKEPVDIEDAVTPFTDGDTTGYDIQIYNLPERLHVIRVYMY